MGKAALISENPLIGLRKGGALNKEQREGEGAKSEEKVNKRAREGFLPEMCLFPRPTFPTIPYAPNHPFPFSPRF